IELVAVDEKVCNRQRIEVVGNRWVAPHAAEIVAEDKRFAALRIKERLHAELISRAEQRAASLVPNREGKITQQALDRTFSPARVRGEYQLRIGRIPKARVTESTDEVLAAVDPAIGDDPCLIVCGERLILAPRF